jgi:hypothetical protein
MSDKKNIVKTVRNWVKNNYKTDNHLIRAEYWLKKLKPDADEAMIIAAITHDIERAFPEGRVPPSPQIRGVKWDDKEYNLWHGRRSAEFVEKFLIENGFKDQEIIRKIRRLITYHEIGGDKETDLIKDADSLSFLEINAPLFISWIPQKASVKEIKEKFDYMFNRISSEKARKLAEPFYKEALKRLKKL